MKKFLGLALLGLSVSAFALDGNESQPSSSRTREEAKANKGPVPSAQTDEYLTKRDENSHLINSGQKYSYKEPQSRYDYSDVKSNVPRGNDYNVVAPTSNGYN